MVDVAASFLPRLPGSGPFIPPTVAVVPLSTVKFVDPDTDVPLADQDGSIAQPFASIQPAVDALGGPGTVALVPAAYAEQSVLVGAVDVTFLGLGSAGFGVSLSEVDITSTGNVGLIGIAALFSLHTTGNVRMESSNCLNPTEFQVSVEAEQLDMFNSTVGTIQLAGVLNAYGSTCLNGGVCSRIVGHDSDFQTVDTTYIFNGGGGELWSCNFFSALLASSPTFRDCNLAGAFTGSDYQLFGCRLQGGSVNVTNTIGLDLETYQSASLASWVATNLISIVDAEWAPPNEQLAWNAGANTSLLTVLGANQHAPGLYLVYAPIVVRTVAGVGTATRTISWSAPTIGAQTNVTTGFALTTLGTKATDAVVIDSSGLANVTVQYAPVGLVGGPPVIDVYAGAQQGGLRLHP